MLATALMPGADHVLAYHLLVKGDGWAACEGQAPVRLASGDIVMFPRGGGHVLSSAPGMRASEDRSDWRHATRDDPKPISVAYHRGVLRPGSPGPADEASTVVVCGFVACACNSAPACCAAAAPRSPRSRRRSATSPKRRSRGPSSG